MLSKKPRDVAVTTHPRRQAWRGCSCGGELSLKMAVSQGNPSRPEFRRHCIETKPTNEFINDACEVVKAVVEVLKQDSGAYDLACAWMLIAMARTTSTYWGDEPLGRKECLSCSGCAVSTDQLAESPWMARSSTSPQLMGQSLRPLKALGAPWPYHPR